MKYKILRRIAKTLLRYLARLPLLDKLVANMLEKRNFAREYHHEILLLRGKHETSNSHQSIVFFTLYRGASSYVSDLLWVLAREEGVTLINLEGYFWNGGGSENGLSPPDQWEKIVYKQKGYLYGPINIFNGPFRIYFEEIPSLEKYKVILMLRDPRDVLVSAYFSTAYSHRMPRRNPSEANRLRTAREEALRMTIDEHVLKEADVVSDIYLRCCQKLLNKSYVLFVKYEEMVNDFESWLDKIIDFAEFHPSEKIRSEIMRGANFKVEKENIYAHKRQVTPGDHRRKLKIETIDALNANFRNILEQLSYREEVQFI